MTTKASTTRKHGRTKSTAKKEINGKKSSVLQIQNLPLGKIKPDPEQNSFQRLNKKKFLLEYLLNL